MGLLDAIEGMAGQQAPSAVTNTSVAGGLMQALEEHPGGLSGVMDSFRHNGMASHVQNWTTGAESSATPDQVQQGLGGTGLIEKVAAKAGVSPEVAKIAMATVLPIVLAHFTQGGQQAPPESGFAGMTSQILSKLL